MSPNQKTGKTFCTNVSMDIWKSPSTQFRLDEKGIEYHLHQKFQIQDYQNKERLSVLKATHTTVKT